MKKRLVIFGLLLCSVLSFATIPATADISPGELVANLKPGDSIMELKQVTIPPGPAPKGDILFAFDLTGSMASQISAAKAQATNIMSAVTPAIVADAQFGVVSFMDYNGIFSSCSLRRHRSV